MKFKLLIIALLIITIAICAYINVRVNKYSKYIEELNQNSLSLTSKYKSSLQLLSIYQRLKQVQIIDTSSLISPSGYQIKIKKIIGNKKHIIMWISNNSCNTCYMRELEILKKIVTDNNQDNIIFLITGFDNNRSFEYFIKEQNIQNYAYFVRPDFFSSNPVVDESIPLISLVDSSLILTNLILLDKLIPSSISENSIKALLHDFQ